MIRASRADDEWEGESWVPGPLTRAGCKTLWADERLARAYALAQAHAGPSMHTGKAPLRVFEKMNLFGYLQSGMGPLEETMASPKVFDTRSSMAMLVMLLGQASEPSLRGTPYNKLLRYLDMIYDFTHTAVPNSFFEKGIPAWVDPQHAGRTPTTQQVLVWVLPGSAHPGSLPQPHDPAGKRGAVQGHQQVVQ